MRAVLVRLGFAFICSAVLIGEVAAQAPSVQALVADGQKVFETTCATQYCHGPGGAGAQGPRLIDHPMTPDSVRSSIREGRSGTPMQPFRNILEPAQIEQVIAYVLSISSGGKLPTAAVAAQQQGQAPEPPPLSTAAIAIGKENGTPATGAAIFFDATTLSSCRTCHTYDKRGGPMGLDLADARKSRAEILDSLSRPLLASRYYPVITVKTKGGVKLTGVRRDETADTLRVFDVAIPPVSRSFLKSEIADIQVRKTGIFDHRKLRLTRQELLDLAALLGTAR